MFSAIFYSYCGMSIPLGGDLSRDAARGLIKRLVKRGKRWGQDVIRHRAGHWEFCSPEDAAMVSDWDGELIVKKVRCRR